MRFYRLFPFEMIAQSLSIPSEYNHLLKKYSAFWNAKSRVNAFENLNISYTELNIIQAILAVLSNQKTLNFDYIVRDIIKHTYQL